jgi:hypothetical protein
MKHRIRQAKYHMSFWHTVLLLWLFYLTARIFS